MDERIFKTRWFTKEAAKAEISDSELLKAIKQVAEGKADDLGGGVFKKRLIRIARSFWRMPASFRFLLICLPKRIAPISIRKS
ncbi:hypothetical protein GGE67_001541 [Rhizobium leucaenae]|nr:hypothetical protein [Rhizobium leucaenae]